MRFHQISVDQKTFITSDEFFFILAAVSWTGRITNGVELAMPKHETYVAIVTNVKQ